MCCRCQGSKGRSDARDVQGVICSVTEAGNTELRKDMGPASASSLASVAGAR